MSDRRWSKKRQHPAAVDGVRRLERRRLVPLARRVSSIYRRIHRETLTTSEHHLNAGGARFAKRSSPGLEEICSLNGSSHLCIQPHSLNVQFNLQPFSSYRANPLSPRVHAGATWCSFTGGSVSVADFNGRFLNFLIQF